MDDTNSASNEAENNECLECENTVADTTQSSESVSLQSCSSTSEDLVLDISKSYMEGPTQPKLLTFPKSSYGKISSLDLSMYRGLRNTHSLNIQ